MAVEPGLHEAAADVAADVLANLRDLGGLPTEHGGTTNHGVLLRSAAPRHGDRAPTLAGWPPALVLDLRGIDELGGQPHPLVGPGTLVHPFPLLDHELTAGRRAGDWTRVPDLATAYLGFLDAGAAKLVTLVRLMADADGATLVHCTAGKDRTGVAVAVLLRAVGVRREALVEDYLATEAQLPAIFARTPASLTASVDPTALQRLMGVPVEAITSVLDVLDAAPGGAAGWLHERGLAESILAAWRRRILGTPPPG